MNKATGLPYYLQSINILKVFKPEESGSFRSIGDCSGREEML